MVWIVMRMRMSSWLWLRRRVASFVVKARDLVRCNSNTEATRTLDYTIPLCQLDELLLRFSKGPLTPISSLLNTQMVISSLLPAVTPLTHLNNIYFPIEDPTVFPSFTALKLGNVFLLPGALPISMHNMRIRSGLYQ